MQWIAHAGWQERGAAPNSLQGIGDALQTDFRIEFDVTYHKGELWLAHSIQDINAGTATLQEVGEVLVRGKNDFSLDVKTRGGEKGISRWIDRYDLWDRALICGHSVESLLQIEGPALRGWSLVPGDKIPGARKDIDGLMLHYSLCCKDNIQKAHDSGMWVHCWTVDEEEVLRSLRNIDLDGITSNCPQRMRHLWNK